VPYWQSGKVHARVETLAVGEALPDMPLYLTPSESVPVPLEAAYWATWNTEPEVIRELVPPLIVP
jgi:hypothetical protein